MIDCYLINVTNNYRVRTVDEALELRKKLQHLDYGELVSFSYTNKEIKAKGEIIDSYIVVKAKIVFTPEKEPEERIKAEYILGAEDNEYEDQED